MTDVRSQLIVALDLPDRTSALAAVERLAGHVGYFKLGLEIFIREGPRLVQEIGGRGEKVFLDLKLHDIPNTVHNAVRSACRLGVHMLTLHAAGGAGMLAAAREAAESEASPPILLAVTALTSLSREDLQRIGISETPVEWVERLASLAHQCRIPGIVASSWELPHLKTKFRDSLRLVIPGIRPSGAATQDQSRTATPAEAIRLGADFLVVGRPILQSQDPSAAADLIVDEMRRTAELTRGQPKITR
jgi:orotidine-5'-phosphate decarboxylase